MRLAKLYVEGYGSLSGFPLTLGRGLVVAHGSNEAGKSTLLAFIRAVCFGFNKATTTGDRRQSHYDPETGQKGGWVEFEVDESGVVVSYRLDRRAIGKGGTLTITRTPGGETWSGPAADEKRAELFHKADDTLFSNIFVIGPDELHALTAVTQKDVESVLFSADAGVTIDLGKEIERLERARDAIWSPRSREAEYDKATRKIEDTQSEIRDLTMKLATYDPDRERIVQIEARVKSILEERSASEKRLRRIESLKTIRQKLGQEEEALAELARLPEVPEALTEKEGERALRLEDQRNSAELSLTERTRDLATARTTLTDLEFNPELANEADNAERLLATLTSKSDGATRHRRAKEKLAKFAARKRPSDAETEAVASLQSASEQIRAKLSAAGADQAAEEERLTSYTPHLVAAEIVAKADDFLSQSPAAKENHASELKESLSRAIQEFARDQETVAPSPSVLTSVTVGAFLASARTRATDEESEMARVAASSLPSATIAQTQAILNRSLGTVASRKADAQEAETIELASFSADAQRLGRDWTAERVTSIYESRAALQTARDAVKSLEDAKTRSAPPSVAAASSMRSKTAAIVAAVFAAALLTLGLLKTVPFWLGGSGAAVALAIAALSWPRSGKAPPQAKQESVDLKPLERAAQKALAAIGAEQSSDSQSLGRWIADLERAVTSLRQLERAQEKTTVALAQYDQLLAEVRASAKSIRLSESADLAEAESLLKARLAQNTNQERDLSARRASVDSMKKRMDELDRSNERLAHVERDMAGLHALAEEIQELLALRAPSSLAASENAIRRRLADAAAKAKLAEDSQDAIIAKRAKHSQLEKDSNENAELFSRELSAWGVETVLQLKELAQEFRTIQALQADAEDLAADRTAFDAAYRQASVLLVAAGRAVPDGTEIVAEFRNFSIACRNQAELKRNHAKQSLELERVTTLADEARGHRDALVRSLNEKLAAWELADVEALSKACADLKLRIGVNNRLTEIRRDLATFAGTDDAVRGEATSSSLAGLGEEEATLQDRVDQDEHERDRVSKEKDDLLPRVSSLENERLTELHAQLASQALVRDEMKWKWAQLDAILYLLNETRVVYEREHGPKVLRRAGELLKIVTHGRYLSLEKTGQYEVVRADSKRRTAAPPHLSRATFAQVYLCLRVAYAELGDHAKFPIIWDDTMSDFDEARCEGLFAALQDVARSRQVIIFTHHKHVRDLGQKAGATLSSLEEPPRIEARVLVKE